MRFESKIAIVLSDSLQTWQKLNATAFLTSGLTASEPPVGDAYIDADGVEYLPMTGQPILVCESADAGVRSVFDKARSRGLLLAIFTRDLFSTGHDAANRSAVAAVSTQNLDVVGIGIFGPRSRVDRCLKGVQLHA